MAQLLANELLIIIFKELLKDTSFEYMNSISTVCKKWNELIKIVLIEEIEFRLKSKINIEYGFNNCSTKNITSYDISNSTFNVFINNNKSELYYLYYSNINERKICINFKYENYKEYVEFNLGTLLFHREKNLNGKYEIKFNNIEWNYKDCKSIFTKDDPQTDYIYIIITIERLIISLKKMCVILDLLDEKLNNNQYKHIIKKRPLKIDDIFSEFFL